MSGLLFMGSGFCYFLITCALIAFFFINNILAVQWSSNTFLVVSDDRHRHVGAKGRLEI